MDFLNQLESDNKDDNSIFTFDDKNENGKDASLPFPFSSQSSQGKGQENLNFLNDMKSQGGESFNLGDIGGDAQNNNFGGIDFLNTICEVPESSNNFFNSQSDNGFLNANKGKNQDRLDFINEDNENEDNNFDFTKFQNDNKNDVPINVDINNLFKSSKTKKNNLFEKNDESSQNEHLEINNLLNINNDMSTNKNNNCDIQNNSFRNKIQTNNNNINVIQNVKSIQNNEVKEKSINTDINTSFNKDNNNNSSFTNANNNRKIPCKLSNPNIINNKEKIPLNSNNNLNNNQNKISRPSSNNNLNINNAIQENKENNSSFLNASIKQKVNKPQKINLDDIDQIISLNSKIENKVNNQNNNIPIDLNFFKGKQDNNKNANIKENLAFLSNEISNIFSSSLMNGKRAELEIKEKDKDLKNIENFLNFTKENITSKSKIQLNQNMSKEKSNNNMLKQINNTNSQFLGNSTQKSNPVLLKQLPGDSFDKKSQLIKFENDNIYLSQMETTSKKTIREEIKPNIKNKTTSLPSKYEMIQKYNELASRLNKIREKAKEYRNIGNYFTQLIIANENYNIVYPNALKKLFEEYNIQTSKLLALMKIKNNKMTDMNNEFFEEVRKYSLAFPNKV